MEGEQRFVCKSNTLELQKNQEREAFRVQFKSAKLQGAQFARKFHA